MMMYNDDDDDDDLVIRIIDPISAAVSGGEMTI